MFHAYEELRRTIQHERLPCAVIDLDAVDHNLAVHLEIVRGHGLPLRIASKSIRVIAVMKRLLERGQGTLQGIMCFASTEAELLAEHGLDDLLLAYPPWQRADLETLARVAERGTKIAVIADSREGIERIGRVGKDANVELSVVLCVDMALSAAGAVLGVRRSPLRHPADIVALARLAQDTPGTSFGGLMGYEAQIAGLGDDSPFDKPQNLIKTAIKRISEIDVRRRRVAMVQALARAGMPARLVNGGGTGSLDTTTRETGVTEVTAGSGFYKSHLFDYYKNHHMRRLRPACMFALEITRKPGPGWVTCLGGGYVASGSPTSDKAPIPYRPQGLSLSPMEMAGEVQTPVAVPDTVSLSLGDPVFFRPAKAGEWLERFTEVLLVRNGQIVERAPTYRGLGACFF